MDHLEYHKRPPVKWKPLTSPNVRGKFGQNLRIMETSSHFQNHHRVTTLYGIPYSKVLNGVRGGAGREHQKCADTRGPISLICQTVSRRLGGGVQIAGGEDEEDGKENKNKKRGGETRHPETKAGQRPPSRLRSLVSFRDGLFRVTCS